MAQVNFFQAIIKSFYSRAFYQDVARTWRGLGLRYLFIVVALASIPYLIGYAIDVQARLADLQELFQLHPEIQIENGQLKTKDRKVLLVYSKTDAKRLLAVIDPAFFADEKTKNEANIILQDNQLLVKGRTGNHYLEYSSIGNKFTLNGDWLAAHKTLVLIFMPLVIWIFSLFSLYFYRILQSLFYSLIALLLFKRKKWHAYLQGHDVVRLCAVALTPCIMITGLGDFINLFCSGIFMPYGMFFYIGYVVINFTYVFLAFYWNRQLSQEPPASVTATQG